MFYSDSFGMLLEDIQKKLKEAMVAKDEASLSVLRMLAAAIHNKEIEKGKDKPLLEEDVLDVLKKELKKRNEAALAYVNGNRPELAQKEKQEADFIAKFLPVPMSEEELIKTIEEVLANFPNATQKDFGNIMKAVMAKTDSGADGAVIARMIKEKLV